MGWVGSSLHLVISSLRSSLSPSLSRGRSSTTLDLALLVGPCPARALHDAVRYALRTTHTVCRLSTERWGLHVQAAKGPGRGGEVYGCGAPVRP